MRNLIQTWAMKVTIALALLLFSPLGVMAQQITVKGIVKDEMGEPILGANARVKGTTNGATTDLDGNFVISNVDNGAVIEFSFVGYITKEVKAQPQMVVTLEEDNKLLEDVVVVGYGVQKKSVVTAAIAKVSADDLSGTAPVRMDNALKGLAAGVNVTSNSGQPGAASKIRVRGTGTVNNSDPLYIVDGMAIEGGFDFLNPSDIESIEVLKDAASGAIYGARAANGVILVTTKKGKKGKATVSYNFSQGWQTAWKHRDVLNASEYMVMRNEGLVNSGQMPQYSDPYNVTTDTDWQDLIFNDNAPVTNHEVTLSGASDAVSYYLSAGYYNQEGIVGGNYGQSNYERLTLRNNLNATLFDLSKERNWLNKIDVSSNISYARIKSTGIDVNSQWGGQLSSALSLPPLIAPYVTGADAEAQIKDYSANYPEEYVPMYDKNNGQLLNIPGAGFNEMANPLAQFQLPAGKNWSHKFVANWSATFQIWDGLKFKTSYGVDMSFWGSNSYQIPHWISPTRHASYSKASAESDRGTVWQLENVLTYDKVFGKHTVNVVLGQSAFKNTGWSLGASRNNIKDFDKPWINASTGIAADGDRDGWGGPGVEHTMSSLFARLSYNYDERYMLQATVRRDGSSRFGPNNKYGVFPSVSLGWNVMNEAFMESTREWLNNLKVRFSWGKNGNDNIGDFRYTVLTQGGNNYGFGTQSIKEWISSKASGLANPDLKWEESEQTDLGIDFGFLNNSLTLTLDYFSKRTNGMLKEMNIPSYVGESKPIGNVGDMKNSGLEIELGYKFNVADATFGIKGNVSYLKNELVKLGNAAGFEMYDNVSNLGNVSRAEAGEPFPFFYGLKTDGIFQNQAEIDAYTNANGQKIQPEARPGFVRYVDANGDGTINDDDRVNLGKGTPDWTFGFTFNAAWKGFDFMMFWQGTQGNDIFDASRRLDLSGINLPGYMRGRWTGEGTSNKYPIYIIGDATNWKASDLYVHDGSYMRLKNIELGYTVPQKWTKMVFISRLRAYFACENLLTFTKYYGFDPEISSAATSSGMDFGVYPQPRTIKVGVNVTF